MRSAIVSSNGRVQTRLVEGVVQAVNASGLKIGGAWLNVSQFRPVQLREPGAHVRVDIDAKGYIKALEVLSGGAARETPAVVRDDRQLRLAVLSAVANFVGLMSQTREDVRSDHVLPLADKWLAWVDQAGSSTGT
jgi:hypothetical protein